MSFCKSDCLVISHVLATGVPRGALVVYRALREVRRARVCGLEACTCLCGTSVCGLVMTGALRRSHASEEKMLIKCQTLLIYRAHINPDRQTAAGIIQLEYILKHWSRVSLCLSGFVLQRYEETCQTARRSGAIMPSLSIHLLAGFSSFIPFSSHLLIALTAISLSLIFLCIFPTVFSLHLTVSQIRSHMHKHKGYTHNAPKQCEK